MTSLSRLLLHTSIAVAASVVILSAALAGSARAASLPGPAFFTTGLVDDPEFESPSNSVRDLWYTRAQGIGSSSVRLGVAWNAIAPYTLPHGFQASNPGDRRYQWAGLDASIRSAAVHGQAVMLSVSRAPRWAEGSNMPSYVMPGAWEPNPHAFAQFAHALAQRYSGHFADPLHPGHTLPRVRYFQAWNEPNLPRYLMPQWLRSSTGAIVAASPGIYRSLLDAFYAAVKAVAPHSVVLAAGTAPYGDPPGVNKMAPVDFLRYLFCLTPSLRATSCPNPPHFDVLDHHPYGVSPTIHAGRAGDVAVPDLGKIWRVLHAAEKVGHVRPAGPKPVWVTEIDWAAIPPVTAAIQARFLSQGMYVLWSEDVTQVDWFELRDAVGKTNSFVAAGLYYGSGIAKPSAAAFRFPFVALPAPHSKKSVILWGKAPQPGTVEIEKLAGGRWRPILSLSTTPGGIFYANRRLSSTLVLRARMGGNASLGWVNPAP